jgi:hypothetical protein
MDKQFAVLIPFPAVSFAAWSGPGRDIVSMRIDRTCLEIFDRVLGLDGVPSCLLSRIPARDETVLQEPTRRAFADVRDLVKLLLGDGIGVILADRFNVLFEFSHADTAFRFSADGGGVACASDAGFQAHSLLNSLQNLSKMHFFSPNLSFSELFELFSDFLENFDQAFIFPVKH